MAQLQATAPVDAVPPTQAVRALWSLGGLDATALGHLSLPGSEPVLPSSFAVSTAAQASIAATALAAAEIRHARGGGRQHVSVPMRDAAQECSTFFTIDGVAPELWDKLSGVYACGPAGAQEWVRVHANFAHHRDGVLSLLGLRAGAQTNREDVARALEKWNAQEFEQAAADRSLVVAAVRSFDQWDAHPQAAALAALPLLTLEKIGDAPPRSLPRLGTDARPLTGLRVLDLTRILAGPVAGRTLAAYGADVMLVNSPALPNIEAIAETSRGKLSAHVDLLSAAGRQALQALVREGHVFIQGYRPGGLAKLGFSPEEAAALCPGLVYVSLSAYGHTGPWSSRRGFDSLVQAATGFNHAEGEAMGDGKPRALPVQILDHASGYLMAYGAQVALLRQLREGGSWHVRVSLARTGAWVRSLGRVADGLSAPKPALDDLLESAESGFGRLVAVRHSARFGETPAGFSRPSVPPGSHPPLWPR